MMHKTSSSIFSSGTKCNRDRKIALVVMLLCFAAGGLIGTVFGCVLPVPDSLSDANLLTSFNEFGFWVFLWRYLFFNIIVSVMGTSFLGPAAVPLLVIYRAYVLSCASASIIASDPDNGLVMSLVAVGIPAVFSVPCFLSMSMESFLSSADIFRLCRGDRVVIRLNYKPFFLFCLPVLACGCAAELELVPYLVALLSK